MSILPGAPMHEVPRPVLCQLLATHVPARSELELYEGASPGRKLLAIAALPGAHTSYDWQLSPQVVPGVERYIRVIAYDDRGQCSSGLSPGGFAIGPRPQENRAGRLC